MAAIGTFYEPVLLNYALLGATATRPTAWALALGAAVPTASTFTEIGTASGYSCQTMPFPSAASATVTNTVAATMGPFSTAVTISGAVIKDVSATGGHVIFYGSLATAATLAIGNSIIFAVGSLSCSIT